MPDRRSGAGEIAACLFLPGGTVSNYLTTIVSKLNARNRIDAVRIAEEAGWIPWAEGAAHGRRLMPPG